jgi:hypothetical protein
MQKNERQASVSFHSELLVNLIEYRFNRQNNINWLTVEKMMQILLCQHHFSSICFGFRQKDVNFDLFVFNIHLENLFRGITKSASTILIA